MSLLGILALILSGLIGMWMPEIDFSAQEKLHASLLQISSIILAITGAWAAIVYPDALQKIIKKKDNKGKVEQINHLIKPMLVSLTILGFLILIQISSFILDVTEPSQFVMLIAHKLNISLLIFLYLLQIYSIVLTFIPISNAKNKASMEEKGNRLLDSLLRK